MGCFGLDVVLLTEDSILDPWGVTLPVIVGSGNYQFAGASGNRLEWEAQYVIYATGSKFVLKTQL
jgi:hypothetical protein